MIQIHIIIKKLTPTNRFENVSMNGLNDAQLIQIQMWLIMSNILYKHQTIQYLIIITFSLSNYFLLLLLLFLLF